MNNNYSFDIIVYCHIPVSYTHLDVYKRQCLDNLWIDWLREITVLWKTLIYQNHSFCFTYDGFHTSSKRKVYRRYFDVVYKVL